MFGSFLGIPSSTAVAQPSACSFAHAISPGRAGALSLSSAAGVLTRCREVVGYKCVVIIILTFSYSMPRMTSTRTISLPRELKDFVKNRSLTAHYGTPSDYIRGLIREDLKRLEEEQLEQALLKGLRSGNGIRMTKDAWQQLKGRAMRDRTH